MKSKSGYIFNPRYAGQKYNSYNEPILQYINANPHKVVCKSNSDKLYLHIHDLYLALRNPLGTYSKNNIKQIEVTTKVTEINSHKPST